MENKFQIMQQLSTLIGKLNDIGHKVSSEIISDKEVVEQLNDVGNLLREMIEKDTT